MYVLFFVVFDVLFEGGLALYDGSGEDFQLIRMLVNTVARGEKFGQNVLSVSGDSLKLAFVGPSEYTITVVDARSLDEVTVDAYFPFNYHKDNSSIINHQLCSTVQR